MDKRVPAFYKIDEERRFVLSTIFGELTYAEALAHQRSISADRDFDPTFAHIADFTHATLTKICNEEVLKFAQHSFSLRTPGGLRSFRISRIMGSGACTRRYEAWMGRLASRAFRTLEEALDWLAGPSPDA